MRIVVLEQPMRAVIEDLDLSVRSTRSDAGTIGVEFHISYHAGVVREGMNEAVGVDVPESHCLVVTARGNHARIEGELGSSNPVGMPFEGLDELSLCYRPHLDCFVV